MELFVRDDFLPLDDGTCLPQLGWFDTSFRFPAVKENNLVWMTVTPNEINTIQPCVRQSHGNVLTFGLGLGYYAFHCLLKPDVRRVTVVERDPDIIRCSARCSCRTFRARMRWKSFRRMRLTSRRSTCRRTTLCSPTSGTMWRMDCRSISG